MAEDRVREKLAAGVFMLADDCDPPLGWQDQEQITDRLLPTVQRLIAEAVAGELRAAAKTVVLTPGIKFHGAAVRDILARADAIEAGQ